jgi:hypothetical protein
MEPPTSVAECAPSDRVNTDHGDGGVKPLFLNKQKKEYKDLKESLVLHINPIPMLA